MLEWTGERFLPWIKESAIAYEHLHRYAYAAEFVKGKRVLDLACGEGYGAKMLSATAASVVGVDIVESVIAHAASKYGGEGLQYISGSITAVPIRDDHSFDAIVCFEAIEHIEDQETLLQEVKRLLKPGGIFLVSTPNKVLYHDESAEENPFHVKELDFEEFKELLARHFSQVRYLGQRIHPSSSIWPIGVISDDPFREFVLERAGANYRFISNEKRVPLYFIAIASSSPAFLRQPGSVLLDHTDGLFLEKDAELQASAEEVRWREQQIADRERTIASLEEAVKWREGQIRELTEGLEWSENRIAEMDRTISSQDEALAWRAHQVEDLESEKAALTKVLHGTQRDLGIATGQLEAIHASSGWKFILKVRRLRDQIMPAGSTRQRLFEKLMGRARPRA